MKIKIIELFKNIRKNLINFISITLFIFFGVSLFLGLDFAAHGIKSTLDDTFTNANMYDLKLKFYGLVDTSDINDLCNIDGVDEVEGFFAT
ncbi:MAG: hypothetical protein MJ236_05075, partial [Clostridia bacterium]|nr:hypothetical protein [Clostridia bacterium]